jgi:hypothetical protein
MLANDAQKLFGAVNQTLFDHSVEASVHQVAHGGVGFE